MKSRPPFYRDPRWYLGILACLIWFAFTLGIGTLAEQQGRKAAYRELYPERQAAAEKIGRLENQVIALGGNVP